MGADLIVWELPIHMDATPDWDAGDRAIEALDPDTLDVEHLLDDEDDSPLRVIRDRVADLRAALTSPYSRELTWIVAGDHVIFITGGMSWGDSPTDLGNVLQDLWDQAPEVLEAIGFGGQTVNHDRLDAFFDRLRATAPVEEAA